MGKVRIPINIADFDAFMNSTDDLQLTVVPPGSDKKFTIWGWTDAESEQWTAFRQESNSLFADYKNPEKKSPIVIEKSNELISKVRSYDNNKESGHHLLDKIALKGTIEDCAQFNIKRSTTRQADPVHHDYDPNLYKAVLNIIKHDVGMHLIEVTELSSGGSKKLPEGMASVKIYRYMGKNEPANDDAYLLLGNGKYGKIASLFSDVHVPEGENWTAYYYARYESKSGKLGKPGTKVKAPMMME